MYKKYIKRILDFVFALAAILVFSWLYIILIILGAVFMRGNPFFVQERPGKDERIFKLIKFRTMDNRKDEFGNLLPDKIRLNKYGRFLRKTSLDEIPEAINILIGDMSIVGPRPLSVLYLPYYSCSEKHRHDIRPGLTGLAQVSGRNNISWKEKFEFDLQYGDSVGRSYYAMFLSAKALLVRDGYDVSSHKSLIGIFGRDYVKKGDFDSNIAKYLSGTQSLRDNADYDAIDTISKEIAHGRIKQAERFIA